MTAFEGETPTLNRPSNARPELSDRIGTPVYSAPIHTTVIDRNAQAFEARDVVAIALGAVMTLAPLAVTAMTGGA